MMTIYNLKSGFQNILRPMAYWLDRIGITPNQITLAASMWCLLYSVGIFFWEGSSLYFFLFPIVFFVRMALNAMDGIIAKEKNKITKLGGLLNEAGDIISDTCLSALFFFVTGVNNHFLWAFIYLSLFVETVGMWAYFIRGQRSYAGPLGKSDRGFVLGIMAFIKGFEILSNQIMISYVNDILILSIILLVVTVINRFRFVIKG